MNQCNEHTLCSHLSARITESGAGFYKMEQVQNSRIVLIGVLYKRSKNARGLMLNVCPFCEAKLGLINQLGEA